MNEKLLFVIPDQCPLCGVAAGMHYLGVSPVFRIVLQCSACEGAVVVLLLCKSSTWRTRKENK